MAEAKLSGAIVGSGRMGLKHAEAMRDSGEFEVVAACDVDLKRAVELGDKFEDVCAYDDLGKMLQAERPDVVVIATDGASHAELTALVAQARPQRTVRPRAISCEKPMAVSLGEARRMVEACRENGVALIVNHQRRLSAPLLAMRRLIEEGAVGEVYLIRASCAGDVLGDGTHAVDSVRWLAGDADVRWVLGQVYRDKPNAAEPKSMTTKPSGGYRYGYPVETGGVATFEFATGVRGELFCGSARLPGRAYQDYEVFGTKGRLWRAGDSADPPLLIQTDAGGGWRPVDVGAAGGQFDPMVESYRLLARTIRTATLHPLSGDSALKGQEVLMAIYESARTNARIELPLAQGEFPLQLMIDAGQV